MVHTYLRIISKVPNRIFEKYSDFVINMPLLFLFHNKTHISPNKKKFKDFMEGKIKDIEYRLPETKDLETHLSTIFTELRLKNYLEIRSLDACEWDCHCAGPAFFTGLIYGKLEEAKSFEDLEEQKLFTANVEVDNLINSLFNKEDKHET